MELSTVITKCGLARPYESGHRTAVLSKEELLTALEAKGVKNSRIADALKIPASRVSEIFRAIRKSNGKPRELTYDEGVTLIRTFGLEQSQRVEPLPAPILRLLVRHVAMGLRVPAQEAQIAELAEDLRAFSEYVANPKVRQSIAAAEGFFQALQLRRPAPEEEARRETDHESDPPANR